MSLAAYDGHVAGAETTEAVADVVRELADRLLSEEQQEEIFRRLAAADREAKR